ncbi:MAG: hypothetical protein Q9184_002720 [Pyrenodesmia sp. 2 TL-2023]
MPHRHKQLELLAVIPSAREAAAQRFAVINLTAFSPMPQRIAARPRPPSPLGSRLSAMPAEEQSDAFTAKQPSARRLVPLLTPLEKRTLQIHSGKRRETTAERVHQGEGDLHPLAF